MLDPPIHELPIHELIDRVLAEHAEIRRDLAEAGALMDVARLRPTFEALRDELLEHLLKEERVLFPWIRSGRGATAVGPIRAMVWEHDGTLAQIAQLRELTDGYRASDPAAAPLCACLERLDRGLRAHIALENEVLFPQALCS
jgi:regulator of cell morphogenesis and NO signaling